MADPKQAAQVRAFLEGLQQERQAKLSETSGIGDLLALEKPAAMLMGSLLAGADQGTRITDMPYYGSVVSPAVKKSRAGILKAALENNRPKPRLDAVPQKLFDYEPEIARRKALNDLNVYVAPKNEGFWGWEGKHLKTKNYEILKNKESHSGLSATAPNLYDLEKPPIVKVDLKERAPLKELEKYAEEGKRFRDMQKEYWDSDEAYRKMHERLMGESRYDEARALTADRSAFRSRAFDFDNYPQPPQNTRRAEVDPKIIKPLSRFIAARYPEATHAGGYRVSGIRTGKAGRGAEDVVSPPLPKLSDTQRLATLQQFEKWLHEKINTRATPKTKTAGR